MRVALSWVHAVAQIRLGLGSNTVGSLHTVDPGRLSGMDAFRPGSI